MSGSASCVDLLIVGAGPAGLTAACWAAQHNFSTRILDRKASRTKTGHADGLQTRTLEILESFGIADTVRKQGFPAVDMCHWAINNKTGKIERVRLYELEQGQTSESKQILLNQGAVEQAFNDYLDSTGSVRVEWLKEAESLKFSAAGDGNSQEYPVIVGVKGRDNHELIHARYLVACDGAHSWAGNQLDVPSDTISEDSDWGVFDIVPITDFPDIRRSCSINSQPHGSIMTVPREKRLVRFYIHLREFEENAGKISSFSPRHMVRIAEKIMSPYHLSYEYCDWWSVYSIGRRLVKQYRPHERVFLAGDAAHTHSPKGGQGMNISIQDAYNLVWKIAAVIINGADPIILETYHSERRPVAEQLMTLDSCLVQAYENEQTDKISGIYEVREQNAGFMSGTDVSYNDSVLVAKEGKDSATQLAQNVEIGMRLPSCSIVYQCDGAVLHLAQRLASNGAWRLLVFSGDLRQQERMDTLAQFVQTYTQRSRLTHLQQTETKEWHCHTIEVLLIHSSPRSAVNLLDLPELFHPFDDTMGWDYWKVFADDMDEAYAEYGIGKEGPGCLVLCRPDQHVAWIGGIEDASGLDNYFSVFIGH